MEQFYGIVLFLRQRSHEIIMLGKFIFSPVSRVYLSDMVLYSIYVGTSRLTLWYCITLKKVWICSVLLSIFLFFLQLSTAILWCLIFFFIFFYFFLFSDIFHLRRWRKRKINKKIIHPCVNFCKKLYATPRHASPHIATPRHLHEIDSTIILQSYILNFEVYLIV